jgi:hypothetical protein
MCIYIVNYLEWLARHNGVQTILDVLCWPLHYFLHFLCLSVRRNLFMCCVIGVYGGLGGIR